jgi:hypothetical protein
MCCCYRCTPPTSELKLTHWQEDLRVCKSDHQFDPMPKLQLLSLSHQESELKIT